MPKKNPRSAPIVNHTNSSKKNKVRLTIYPPTKELVMVQCKDLFLQHHPELKGFRITEDFIVTQIAEYYLREP